MDVQASVAGQLLAEHDRLDQLFEALLAAFEADARDDAARLWSEFDQAFTDHLAREEKFLLPRVEQKLPRLAAAIRAEHDDLRTKLLALGIGVDLHVTKARAVAEFVATLRAHAAHEEATLYPFAEDEAGADARLAAALLGR
jgi:hemerythrin-like domain-containing protein